MDAAKCDQCGAEFFPEATGWSACADCLAAQIELTLLQELRLGQRKPMRRARDRPDEETDSGDDENHVAAAISNCDSRRGTKAAASNFASPSSMSFRGHAGDSFRTVPL